MKKMIKKLLPMVLSAAMLLSIVGCGQQQNEAASSAQAEKTAAASTVRVGVLSIDDSLPIFVAEQEGYFKEAGLDVKVFPFKSSSEQSQAFEAGELDIVMNDMVVQSLMKKAGKDTKVIATAFGATPKEGRFVVVAAPNSDIEKPEDLLGKKVAISTNTMMEYLVNQYESYYKLDKEQITLVNMPNLMLRLETLLQGKDIDAAILPDPLASFAISKGAKAVIDDTTLSENFSQSVFLADNTFVEDNTEAVQTFVTVLKKSMTDINEHPDKYRQLALEKAKVPENLKESYPMPTFTPGAVPTEEEVERVQKWLVDKKLIDGAMTYSDIVNQKFVKA